MSIFPYGDFGKRKNGLLTLVDVTKQKQIDKAKTEFVALASHQLRTPISAIKWNIELLASQRIGTLTEKQYEYAEKIERVVGTMDALVGDFLNVSQLELGTFAPEPKDIELSAFLEEVLGQNAPRIEKKGIVVERNYVPSTIVMKTDERLLRMIMSNLVSNALKYTPPNGRVMIGMNESDTFVTLSVEDSGIGIPKEDQESLFTKFYRASNVRTSMPEGTGLGLYIAHLAAGILGGTLVLQSEEGVGSTFTVTLPR